MTSEENRRVYARCVRLLSAQDFAALPEVVDPGRYREICVGFTPGWVDLPEAVASLEKVVGGITDLNARIDDLVSEDDEVYTRLTVTGTNTGRFFGAPPTGRRYEASMFDYARLEDGRIVERSSARPSSPSDFGGDGRSRVGDAKVSPTGTRC